MIAPLKPTRQALSVTRLWSPLPEGWENTTGGNPYPSDAEKPADAQPLAIPHDLFRHRAIVLDAAQHPIALVVETYTSGVLEFAH